MSRAVMMNIDGQILSNELKKRGLTPLQVDEDTGRTDGYMRKAIRRGTIAVNQAKMLQAFYNLNPEVYAVGEAAGHEEEQISMEAPTPQEIQDAIYQGALTIIKAISESATQLAGPMKRIADALEAQNGTQQPQILPWGEFNGEEDDF